MRAFGLWHYLTLPWYFVRGGRCPHCGEPRPWRAPALEAATVALFLFAYVRFGGQPLTLAVTWLYITFLLAVLVIDFEHHLVLNVMLLPAAVAALVVSLTGLPGFPNPLAALSGGLTGLALFLVFALVSRGHMGAGDVKLAGLVGLMLGFPVALTALFAGVVLGGLGAIILLATRQAGVKSYMAYGPYLCLGALAALLGVIGR